MTKSLSIAGVSGGDKSGVGEFYLEDRKKQRRGIEGICIPAAVT